MNRRFVCLWEKIREFAANERGQDLVEYALVVALISFCAIATMRNLAAGIVTAYGRINTILGSTIT